MATYSWADLINSAPEQEQAPLSIWDLAAKRQKELGLTPGMEGTTTLYTGAELPFGSPNMSLLPFEGANAHTFYTPPEGAFSSPLEGMERLYKQALGGNVQEEYVNPAFAGATGRDTTNYDWLSGLDPYKKDWGLSDSAFFQQKQPDWNFVDNVLKNPGMLFTMGALGGVLAGGASGAAGASEGLSSIGPAQGSILEPGLQASGAITYPVANPYAGIEAIGAGAGGGAMANELIYSDIGPAQGSILEPGAQASGATTYPVDPNPYAGITAKPTGSIWDKAKELAGKMPSAPGGGTGQMEGGGEGGEETSIWSDTVTPYGFNSVNAYQPTYLDIRQQQFPFEAELQRRLALIRGAR